MTDTAWIDAALTSARPQAVGALLRYFRNLDTAEEAFQNACLRALKSWPQNGPPRDPAAWLIMVGRNVAIDDIRRSRKQQPLPEDDAISDLDDAEEQIAERLDGSHYRDDILRLLFICCHPGSAGDAADRARAAHRVRPDREADRARVPGDAKRRWSSASPAPRPASPRPTCRSRRRARWSAASGSPAWRR